MSGDLPHKFSLLMTEGSLDYNRCPHIFERDPNKWGFLRSSLGESKPPRAVDLTCVAAPSLGLYLDVYLDAYFGRLFLDE